ncbi:hypothetical protein LI015_18110 [Enterocloster sp. 210928-DFI.2.20]|uniref:hypothetical protein n=1 Tax=Enterocloster TaxID=2719313 RepID=UPI001D05D7C4|nr:MULTISPECIES: hypothetical protein [Enterocloster]MCB7096685.1 hypothetical protein [Enterocloster sp. 210928-DFI.2.20]MCB7355690.1 hypothetical protein [Enterocloster bolteae]
MTEKTKEIKARADRLVELTAQKERIQAEMEEIKAWFENLAVNDLKDTKKKTVEYWGSSNARVVVGNSETVKPVSMAMVKRLLNTVYPDFVTEKTSYSLAAPAKRLFTIAYLGAYTEGTLDDTIQAITKDEKLKGKYEKDTESLMKSAGLDAKEASDWAYLVSEVVNWEWMLQVLKAAEWSGTPQEAVDIINAAVIVDESLKVTVGAEEKS